LTPETIKLIGTYVFGIIILGFTGWMMVSGHEVPEFWSNLVALIAGALFVGNGVVKSIRRYKDNGRK